MNLSNMLISFHSWNSLPNYIPRKCISNNNILYLTLVVTRTRLGLSGCSRACKNRIQFRQHPIIFHESGSEMNIQLYSTKVYLVELNIFLSWTRKNENLGNLFLNKTLRWKLISQQNIKTETYFSKKKKTLGATPKKGGDTKSAIRHPQRWVSRVAGHQTPVE